jgi:hypothetical protein
MTDDEAIVAAQRAQSPSGLSNSMEVPKEWEGALKGVQLDSLLKTPVGQVAVVLAKDPAFRQATGEIAQKFDRNAFLGYEFAWIIVIWVVRAWRLSKVNTLLTRLWTQAWVGSLFWWGALALIQMLLWGKSFQMVLATAFRAIIHQFWT